MDDSGYFLFFMICMILVVISLNSSDDDDGNHVEVVVLNDAQNFLLGVVSILVLVLIVLVFYFEILNLRRYVFPESLSAGNLSGISCGMIVESTMYVKDTMKDKVDSAEK